MKGEKLSKIGFVCCVKEGYDCISGLNNRGGRIDFIITFDEESASKYSGALHYDKLASDANIPLYKVKSINDPDSELLLRRLSPDLLFVIGWSEILRKNILDIPVLGVIGFHASLLPEYRGPAPVNWAIINGEKQTGNTMFWMSPGIDTGNIIDQRVISIGEDDTCASLYEKVSMSEVEVIMDNIEDLLTGKQAGKPQITIHEKSKRRFPDDGLIQWNKGAYDLYNFIRALTHPYPGAFTFFRNKKLYFWRAEYKNENKVLERSSKNVPGAVLDISSEGITIETIQGLLVLKELQFKGEELLDGRKFAEIYNIKISDNIHDTPRSVAVFASHYDDEVLGIGGTLIEHFKRGDEIYIYIVCESSSVRYKEKDVPLHSFALDAACYLGARNLTCFEYPDQRLDTIPLIDLTQKIESEISRVKPDFVYTHFSGDINEDHKIINKAVMTACRPYSANYIRMLAVFETPSSTEWGNFQEGESSFSPNCFVDISNSLERKLYAMRCYKSEVKSGNHPRAVESLKNRAKYWGTVCDKEYVEPLIVIRLLDHLNPIA